MSRSLPILLLAGFLVSCGDEDGSAADGGEGGSDTTVSGSLPPVGSSADGWIQSSLQGSATASCDATPDDLESSSAPRVSIEGDTLYVGYEQVSGNNQDPRVIRVRDGAVVYCVAHETAGPDGRAVSVTWDGGEHAYVQYTVVGGGTELDGASGWLESFAPGAISGGDKKVTFIGRLNVEDGSLGDGTWVISVLNPSEERNRPTPKVNSHQPAEAITVLEDGNVEFRGDANHKPIDPDGMLSMDCPDEHGNFETRYVFSPDLKTLICAEAVDCTSSSPCD